MEYEPQFIYTSEEFEKHLTECVNRDVASVSIYFAGQYLHANERHWKRTRFQNLHEQLMQVLSLEEIQEEFVDQFEEGDRINCDLMKAIWEIMGNLPDHLLGKAFPADKVVDAARVIREQRIQRSKS